jgi:hypothetical protein
MPFNLICGIGLEFGPDGSGRTHGLPEGHSGPEVRFEEVVSGERYIVPVARLAFYNNLQDRGADQNTLKAY